MRKKIVQQGRPQVKIRRMCIACWIPKAIKHTLRTCKTHCYSNATMDARTRLIVTLYAGCLSCSMSRVTHTNASAYTPLNKEAADSARRLLQYCQLPDQKNLPVIFRGIFGKKFTTVTNICLSRDFSLGP